MYHIIYIVTISLVSQHCLFNCTYMQQTVRQCVHPKTEVKIKTNAFLHLPGMESTNSMK